VAAAWPTRISGVAGTAAMSFPGCSVALMGTFSHARTGSAPGAGSGPVGGGVAGAPGSVAYRRVGFGRPLPPFRARAAETGAGATLDG